MPFFSEWYNQTHAIYYISTPFLYEAIYGSALESRDPETVVAAILSLAEVRPSISLALLILTREDIMNTWLLA